MLAGRANAVSLLLHGSALVALVGGLHAHPPPPAPPSVIEMTFLAPPEVPLEPEAPPSAAPEAEREASTELAEEIPDEPPPAEAPPPEPLPQPQAPPPPPAPLPRAAPRPRHAPHAASPANAAPGPAPQAPAPAASAPAAALAPPGYVMALFAALERRKEYPESARWRRAEGVALLRVSLRRDGSVIAWRIERSSGHADLDASLEQMVRRASPLPAPPPEVTGDPVQFTVPVRFSLR